MEYTSEQVQSHNTDGDRWIIFQDCVYDISGFDHPGGIDALRRFGGMDATAAMFAVEAHSEHLDDVKELLEKMKIGTLKK